MNPQPQPPRRRPGRGRGGRIRSNDDCLIASRRACLEAAAQPRPASGHEPMIVLPNLSFAAAGGAARGAWGAARARPEIRPQARPEPLLPLGEGGAKRPMRVFEAGPGSTGLRRGEPSPGASRLSSPATRARGSALAWELRSPARPEIRLQARPEPLLPLGEGGAKRRMRVFEAGPRSSGVRRGEPSPGASRLSSPASRARGSALAWELRSPARPEIRLQALEKARFAPEHDMASGSASPRDASALRRGEDLPGASRPFPGREPMHHQQAPRSPGPEGGWPPQAIFASRAERATS